MHLALDQLTYFHDPLYGRYGFPTKYIPLITNDDFLRLHDTKISLPTGFMFVGDGATRATHSRGVAYLGSLVAQHQDFAPLGFEIFASGLFHDLGHGPFSHGSEDVMERVLGQDHETRTVNILRNSSIRSLIQSMGGNVDDVLALVTGTHPTYGGLCNASFDLDSAENTLRYGVGLGVCKLDTAPYCPQFLARSFRLRDGRLCLAYEALDDLMGWHLCRDYVYRFIYARENKSPEAMLKRALYLAAQSDKIHPTFFDMTDSEAIRHLLKKCGISPKVLMEKLLHLEHFHELVRFPAPEQDAQELADSLAEEALIAPEHIAVDVCRFTGVKKVKLPLLTTAGQLIENPLAHRIIPPPQATVFVHPSLDFKATQAMRDLIKPAAPV